ncbi:MAG: PAS domain S-box protein [Pseudomonadota bacterium]|nr:PAS domain S-box protein [Pseudomonadota bacterium]
MPLSSSFTSQDGPASLRQARWLRGLLRADWLSHLIPLVTVLLFLAAIASAFWYLRVEEMHREREVIKRDLEYGQQHLRLHLLARQEQIMRLAHDIGNGDVDNAGFAARAQALVMQAPELRALHWIDAQRRLLISEVSLSENTGADDLQNSLLTPGPVRTGFDLARDLLQPVYSSPLPHAETGATLQLHVPIRAQGQFDGELLAEYSVDGLLHHGMPLAVLTQYATAFLDGQGRFLAGHSILDRPSLLQYLPWSERLNAFEVPVSPVGNELILRAQAWSTSPYVVGNTLFWLAAALAAMTAWMLIANWRQSRHRQRAQQALQAETSFRRAMENSVLTGMRALDMQGHITYVNPAFCQMTGWSEQELLGQSQPFSYWPDEDREALSALLTDELGGTVDPTGLQMRVKRKDGSLFDARLYVSPLIDASGRQTGWMGSMTDITEPNRVRQQLSAAHDRFTIVLEALDASVSVAPLGSQELLFANKLYRQWFGTTTHGHMKLLVRGGTPKAQLSDESLDIVDAFAGLPLDGLATAPVTDHAEVYIERLDKWLEVRTRYLNWVDGRLAQMVIATDITARHHAAELAAAQAERAQTASRLITMGEMASSVAHELNQPLTAISNYCTGMISRIKGGGIAQDDLLGALEKTARQAQRAGQVVHHIRSFVKRSEPRRQWAEVDTMMEQVIELAEIVARRRHVQLTHQVAARLPALFVDPILIEQALINLIKNGAESIDAAERPPGSRKVELRVGAREIDGMPVVQFSVTDTGRGLPPEVLERLFEAFFSTKTEGLGIGLNLCRSIVEAHQGRISAENLYNAGHIAGCRFTFWIPVGPAHDGDSPSTNGKTATAT